MLRAHPRCLTRDGSKSGLPETKAFEKLFRDASEALGISVVEGLEMWKFRILESPHTLLPPLREESAIMADVMKGKEITRL
jgi:hypothetical protein